MVNNTTTLDKNNIYNNNTRYNKDKHPNGKVKMVIYSRNGQNSKEIKSGRPTTPYQELNGGDQLYKGLKSIDGGRICEIDVNKLKGWIYTVEM